MQAGRSCAALEEVGAQMIQCVLMHGQAGLLKCSTEFESFHVELRIPPGIRSNHLKEDGVP